jgi:hypothetical protein
LSTSNSQILGVLTNDLSHRIQTVLGEEATSRSSHSMRASGICTVTLAMNLRLADDIDQDTFASKSTEIRDRLASPK